jgi:sulfite exporter TauE/SafE
MMGTDWPLGIYGLALMTGVLGSGHCLGMCGALVSGFFIKAGGEDKGPWPYIAYHGARITVYTTIGAIAALAGAALVSTGIVGKIQGILQIVVGLVVILLGLEVFGKSPVRLTISFAPTRWLHQGFARAAATGTVKGAASGGVVNGLMPCSLTLAMAVKATTAGSPAEGGLLMLAFGAGTVPSMLLVSVVFGKLGAHVRGHLLRAAAVTVMVMGLMTLWQGIRFFLVMKDLPNW